MKKVCCHMYADDTQLYLALDSITPESVDSMSVNIHTCITNIFSWMTLNHLKLNTDKTEILICRRKHLRARLNLSHLAIGQSDVNIKRETSVNNLGVYFDPDMSMDDHIKHVCKSTHFHLRNIGKIRKFLTKHATEQLVHSLVTSRIDYGNALLYGITQSQMNRLQHVHNTAVRLISKVSTISPYNTCS